MRHPLIFETVVILWVAMEIVCSFGKRASAAIARDRGSLTIIWVTLIAAMFFAGMLSNVQEAKIPTAEPAFWIGMALVLVGMIIRAVAIVTLGRYFTVNVAIQKEHELIERGMYRHIRHPSYLGSLLSFLGVGLAMGNWLSLAVAFLVPFIAFSYRMAVEERALVDHFGDRYRDYAGRTKRLIPRIY
jgi:protein-S-isoprenylcysteine O-methyltransferase Ste14